MSSFDIERNFDILNKIKMYVWELEMPFDEFGKIHVPFNNLEIFIL